MVDTKWIVFNNKNCIDFSLSFFFRYVTEDPDFNDPQLFMFKKIFQAFKIVDEVRQM